MENRIPSLGQLATAAMIVVLSTGCYRSHEADEMAGEYILVSVDGKPLPVRIYESDISYQDVVGGRISLTETREALFVTESRRGMYGMARPPDVDRVAGTYTYGNGDITLDLPNSPPVTISCIGDKLTLDVGHVFVWRRRSS